MGENPRVGLGGQTTSSSMLSEGVPVPALGYAVSTLEAPMSMFVGTKTVAPSVAAPTTAAMGLPMSVLSQIGPDTPYLPNPLAPTATIVAPVVVGLANSQFGWAFSGSAANMLMGKNAVPPKVKGQHND